MLVTKEDLILRLGEQKVKELTTRTVFDVSTETYIGDTSDAATDAVLNAAIGDAKSWMLSQLRKCFDVSDLNDWILAGERFGAIFSTHFKLVVSTLKYGGDCDECDKCKVEFEGLCMTPLCSDGGVCLPRKSRFNVTENSSCLPESVCCVCKQKECCCG